MGGRGKAQLWFHVSGCSSDVGLALLPSRRLGINQPPHPFPPGAIDPQCGTLSSCTGQCVFLRISTITFGNVLPRFHPNLKNNQQQKAGGWERRNLSADKVQTGRDLLPGLASDVSGRGRM